MSNALSQRQLRVGEQVRHALALVLQRSEIRDPAIEGNVISVSEVRMSPDLKIATAYVSLLGNGDKEEMAKALNRNARYIRGLISSQLRQFKYMPEFRFRLDTSFANFEKIDRLLRSPEVSRDLTDTGSEDDE